MGKVGMSAGLRGAGLGFCLFLACLLDCGSAQAQASSFIVNCQVDSCPQPRPTCVVSGAVGVPFAVNLAVACANDNNIAACPLLGRLPAAPGINTLGGCTISGTPTEAGVFTGTTAFQIGATVYELEVNLCPATVTLLFGDASGTGFPTSTTATFVAENNTLLDYAQTCGFAGFDWVQIITQAPLNSFFAEFYLT